MHERLAWAKVSLETSCALLSKDEPLRILDTKLTPFTSNGYEFHSLVVVSGAIYFSDIFILSG
jgi:hypothetical protein